MNGWVGKYVGRRIGDGGGGGVEKKVICGDCRFVFGSIGPELGWVDVPNG